MNILGISAFYHDSASALLVDGEITAAAQEERFTRKKHDSSFPINSVNFCLTDSGLSPGEIDYVVFYEKPFLKFERILETYIAFAPKSYKSFSASSPLWFRDKLFQKRVLAKRLNESFPCSIDWTKKLLFSEHHLSHAASAFFPSPFENAAILTMDAVGEWSTTSIALGNQNRLKLVEEINFPHSLGLLYSAFTQFLGFRVNSGEYKVMGLAPYGTPRYTNLIKEKFIHLHHDGSFSLDMKYFGYGTSLTMTNRHFAENFGCAPREPEQELQPIHMDIAASIQQVTDEVVMKIARYISQKTSVRQLCLAGGVALNCVSNGKLSSSGIFDDIWIQPAAGDAGGAIGAALVAHHIALNSPRDITSGVDKMRGSFLGPQFSNHEIVKFLSKVEASFKIYSEEEMIERTASAVESGLAVGWFQGRMEFGPRALGARSILADARSPQMQKLLNLKIKYRESFRPFAPSVLAEDCFDWFDLKHSSPYMLFIAKLLKDKQKSVSFGNKFGLELLNEVRSEIPAVTHVDFSARIQTVHKDTNPKYYKLLKKFKDLTGCPVIVNTSFNIRGEPIVCTPQDAYNCFMGTELDVLVLENVILYKRDQDSSKIKDYRETILPD